MIGNCLHKISGEVVIASGNVTSYTAWELPARIREESGLGQKGRLQAMSGYAG